MDRQRTYIVGLALALSPCMSHAVEFNDAFLQLGPDSTVNLEQFEQAGYIVPGRYIVDIYLNQRYLQQMELDFRPSGPEQQVQPCLPPDLIRQLGLRASILWPQDSQCVDLPAVSQAKVRYSKSNGKLDIQVPQADLAYRDEDYAPPETWNDGIPAALLDYRVFYQKTDNGQNGSSSNITSYGVAGANLGPWRLRSNYQYDNNIQNGNKLSWNNTQVYRDLRGLQARLTVGEVFTTSDIFDAFSMRGATLNSDDRMIPQSLRGYAPQINGIARTNALVTVRNQGRVLYSTNVPPGPFSIRDLGSTAQGQLEVTIEEADGSKQKFTVNTASVPFLTRNGMLRYKMAVGQADMTGSAQRPNIATAEASYGLTNTFSLYSGFIASADYHAAALGVAQDMGSFGAISADITQASARMPDGNDYSGKSYRLNYAKKLDSIDADLRLFNYRFSEQTYRSLSQYLNSQNGTYGYNYKQSVGLNASKSFGRTTLFLSGERATYWNTTPTQRVDLSMSRDLDIGPMRNVSVNFSLQSVRDQSGNNLGASLSFSLPLDNNRRINYSVQGGSGNTTHLATYSDNSRPNQSYNVSASISSQDTKPQVSGDYHYNGSALQADLSASKQQGGYGSLSAGLASSLLLHAGGVSMSTASTGETRLLVDTDGVPGVPVYGSAADTDRNGYAVLTGIGPYQSQDIRLDADNMPDTVEASAAVRRVVLTEGAVGKAAFPVKVGRKALLQVRLADGSVPPLGATVIDLQTRHGVGMVGDNGLTFVSGLGARAGMEISWGTQRCRLAPLPAEYDLNQGSKDALCAMATE
ncbi:fimbria/pilus outer membrane usher protein [Chromobacterium amazonense]|uniref:fimbria/pilus outer membrane usher protein n=1 Tax=Chromobacterium amazonense TaxID=1382803 RepID=UPI0021B7E521|nr:fimbria/pilus outer membrane usher protein [Chromobacterium amazonense]MBM2883130.1 fimbrial biogenesis outer membrane usher protein [Chromobacterium amazonense]